MSQYYSFFRSHTSIDFKKITSLTLGYFFLEKYYDRRWPSPSFFLTSEQINLYQCSCSVPGQQIFLWHLHKDMSTLSHSIFSSKQWSIYFSSRNPLKEVSTNNPNKFTFYSLAIMNSNQWWTELNRPAHWKNAYSPGWQLALKFQQ